MTADASRSGAAPPLAVAFALATLPLMLVATLMHGLFDWQWLGAAMSAEDQGALAGALIAAAGGCGLLWRRRGALTEVEAALYWLGLLPCVMFIGGSIFDLATWSYYGSGHVPRFRSGYATAIAVAWGAAARMLTRPAARSGLALAIYWIGAAVSLVFLSVFVADLAGATYQAAAVSRPGPAAALGAILSLAVGAALAAREWHALGGVAISIYWLGAVLLMTITSIFIAVTLTGGAGPGLTPFLLAPVFAGLTAALLVWQRGDGLERGELRISAIAPAMMSLLAGVLVALVSRRIAPLAMGCGVAIAWTTLTLRLGRRPPT